MPNQHKQFICPKCTKLYKNRLDYQGHISKCMFNNKYGVKCSNCGEGFTSRHGMYKHRNKCSAPTGAAEERNKQLLADMINNRVTSSSSSSRNSKQGRSLLKPIARSTSLIEPKDEPCTETEETTAYALVEDVRISQTSEDYAPSSNYNDAGQQHILGKSLWRRIKDAFDMADGVKIYYIYVLIDPVKIDEYDSIENAIFYVGKAKNELHYMEWFREHEDIVKPENLGWELEGVPPDIDYIWRIWNAERGVGVLKLFHTTNIFQATTLEACLSGHLRNKLLNDFDADTFYGPAKQWTFAEKESVAKYMLHCMNMLYETEGLPEIYLENVRMEMFTADEDCLM